MAKTKDQSLAELTDLCDMLSDPNRLQIVLLLAKDERNVGSMSKELKLSQPVTSHHLGLLRMNRVIVAKRNGKQVIYSLADKARVSGGKLKISLGSYTVTVEGF